jgi:hypothetical protein
MNKLAINQKVTIEGKIYEIIGIDHYVLNNLFGELKRWDSYTLIDNKNNKTWVSYGAIKDYYLQWSLISAEEFRDGIIVPANLDLTGIANVTFEGNQGYSTPTAELVWFDLKDQKYDYFVFERFLENNGKPQEAYYDAGKILKDFKV